MLAKHYRINEWNGQKCSDEFFENVKFYCLGTVFLKLATFDWITHTGLHNIPLDQA